MIESGMSVEEYHKQADSMREFRECVIRYAKVMDAIDRLGAYVGKRNPDGLLFNDVRVEDFEARLQLEHDAARKEVASRLREATEICLTYALPYMLKITPPPATGGYIHDKNVFHALIDDDLPYGYQLNPQKVIDIIDQAIIASEFAAQNPPPKRPWYKVCGDVIGKVWNALFRTELQKSIFGWLLIGGALVLLLKLFGFNPADTAKGLLELIKAIKG